MPLPDLVGVVDFPTSGPGKEARFDFGQQFSEIHEVWIEVEAHVVAREFDVCGTTTNPESCVHHVQLLGFVSLMDEDVEPGVVWGDGLSFFDGCNLYEGSGVDVARFNNNLVGWDFLLGGHGSLVLYWNLTLGNPDLVIRNLTLASGEIFSARLIVEASPIPEPSTSLLYTAALVVVVGLRK